MTMKYYLSLRKTLLLVPMFCLLAAPVLGQSTAEEAKKLQRPKASGIKDYDEFKNSSFNLLQELLKTDDNYAKIKTDVNGYAGGTREATVANIKGDYGRLKKLKKAIRPKKKPRAIRLKKSTNTRQKKKSTKARKKSTNTGSREKKSLSTRKRLSIRKSLSTNKSQRRQSTPERNL